MNDLTKITVADAFKHLRPTQSLGEGISSGFVAITYSNQKWALRLDGKTKMFANEDGTLNPNLDVVIVGMNPNISKMFYHQGTYVEGQSNNPPVCASLNGDKPDPGVPEPQNPVCAGCPHNEWGSGQGKGKACQDHRKLAVLILPYMTKGMLDKPLLEPVFLKVNPNSLKSLKSYGDSLQYRGVHWATVITRVIWNPKKPWEMSFTVLQPLTDKEAPVILPLLDSPMTKNIIGSKVEVYEEEQAPPALQKKTASQQQDSGLLQAFEGVKDSGGNVTPMKRGPGRPRKATELNPPTKPEHFPTEQQAESPQQETGNGGGVTPPWDEADAELSEAVNRLTEKKMNKMLPPD